MSGPVHCGLALFALFALFDPLPLFPFSTYDVVARDQLVLLLR
jgi:hypothetical protein